MTADLETLINIDVDDLAKAERFYCDAFGLRPARRFGSYGLELLGATSAIYLLAKPAGSPATKNGANRTYDRHWTPIHLDFIVRDIEKAVATAEAAGATREGGINTHVWGRIAQLADPWGNGFCLIQTQGRFYDEIADRTD